LGFYNHITVDKTSYDSLRHEYSASYSYGKGKESAFPLRSLRIKQIPTFVQPVPKHKFTAETEKDSIIILHFIRERHFYFVMRSKYCAQYVSVKFCSQQKLVQLHSQGIHPTKTQLLAPWSRVLLEKLRVSRSVKKLQRFHYSVHKSRPIVPNPEPH
jgi:hypothetical protein